MEIPQPVAPACLPLVLLLNEVHGRLHTNRAVLEHQEKEVPWRDSTAPQEGRSRTVMRAESWQTKQLGDVSRAFELHPRRNSLSALLRLALLGRLLALLVEFFFELRRRGRPLATVHLVM